MLSEEFNGPVTLMVAYTDDDEFIGVLADSQAGTFARVGGGWATITPSNRMIAGANVVDVDEDILDFVDKLESRGSEPTLKQALSYATKDEEPTDE